MVKGERKGVIVNSLVIVLVVEIGDWRLEIEIEEDCGVGGGFL